MRDTPLSRRWSLAVLLLAAVLLAWNLGGFDLWAPDEPYFGEGAREMIADGHWVVPHVLGEVSTDKPPLFFWLIALVSLPWGGISNWTARLPSLLAALGTLALTLRLARRWWGDGVAALSVVFLATMVLFWRQARSAQIDALLCFLVLVSLSAFEAFRAGRARGRPAGLLFWGAAAAATLAKGPVGLLIPLLAALLTLAADRDLRAWRRFAPFSGPALFLVLTGAWAAAAGATGEYSVFAALRQHFLERAVHGMHHAQPPWYYLTTLPVDLLPWTGLVIGGLVLAWRERRDSRMQFLLVWSAAVVLMFSVSTEKRDLYVLPAFPAFALLAAGLVAALAGREGYAPSRRWVTVSLGIFGGIAVLAGAALPIAARRTKLPIDLSSAALALAVPLVLGGIVILVVAAQGRGDSAIAATAAVLAVCYLVAQSVVFPAVNPIKSVRPFAVAVARETAGYRAAGNQVLELGLRNEPRAIAFYSKGVYPVNLDNLKQLEQALAGLAPVYATIDDETMAALPAPIRGRLRVLLMTRMSDADVMLVRSEPPPASPVRRR